MSDRFVRRATQPPLQTNFRNSNRTIPSKSLCDISENQKGFQIDSNNIANDDGDLNIS